MNSIFIQFILAITLLFSLNQPVQANILSKTNGKAEHPIDITINKMADLNFQSKAEILTKRARYVIQQDSLLKDKYEPSSYVFNQIEDFKPWWGIYGACVWGPGQHSIDGPAEESRFILNPFLLVGVNSGTALIWNTKKITDLDLKDPNFPFCWCPASLKFYSDLCVAQATYSISGFNEQVKLRANKLRFTARPLKLNRFGLIAYNALDFGFKYIYLDISKSINIVNINGCSSPVLIKQLIHCGQSCKYPGGCNNMSPAMSEIDQFALTDLPARASIYLWKNRPLSVNEKSDFTFYIDFH